MPFLRRGASWSPIRNCRECGAYVCSTFPACFLGRMPRTTRFGDSVPSGTSIALVCLDCSGGPDGADTLEMREASRSCSPAKGSVPSGHDFPKLCQPRTFSPGSGFSKTRERSGISIQGLALVAGRPFSPPQTTHRSSYSGASTQRPGGPTAKRQPSPAGLGINSDEIRAP